MHMHPIPASEHEEVYRVSDPEIGLTGFIAVHSTVRGPAAGGLRMRRYDSEAEALRDALLLSRGMSYKNAAADLPLGGGKAVIMGDAAGKTPEMLRAMGEAVARLEGRYWTAEDMGMSPADMDVVAERTAFVAGRKGVPFASGDPSPVTARGVFNAMRIAVRRRLGGGLKGRRVALQGLGHVGWHLADLLHGAGARLVVTDADAQRVAEAQRQFGAEGVGLDAIYDAEADVFAPCAIGAVINAQTVARLKVSVVAGAANNQLADAASGAALHGRGILYAPDYIANAGGIVNAATEILRIGNREGFVADKLAALERTMQAVLERAGAEGLPPEAVADATVEPLLTRTEPALRHGA